LRDLILAFLTLVAWDTPKIKPYYLIDDFNKLIRFFRLATIIQAATSTKKTTTFQTRYQLEVMEPDVATLDRPLA